MSFKNYLLGHWTNKFQAQSNPHYYSQVEIIWEVVDGGLHSKNFYRAEGPNNPYRERYHKVVVVSDTEVIVENYDLNWTRSENCDMMFMFDGQAWHGKIVGDKCTGNRGQRVNSEIHLFGNKLHSCDQGYSSEGEMIWGSKNLYKFTRKGE